MVELRSYQISFKEVFTSRVINVNVNPFYTITKFLETIIPLLARELGINKNEIEIVPACQYINGNLPESGKALLPESRRLCDIWGSELVYLAFYIRRKNLIYPQIERREANNNQRSYEEECCPICLASTSITRRYSCSHVICETCYCCCQSASITVCSLCRAH